MMRNIRTLMVAIALFFGATTMLTAQVKIAHIDVQKLLEEMPERKSIEAQLKKLEQGYSANSCPKLAKKATRVSRTIA